MPSQVVLVQREMKMKGVLVRSSRRLLELGTLRRHPEKGISQKVVRPENETKCRPTFFIL
jgi:hypothetical protein